MRGLRLLRRRESKACACITGILLLAKTTEANFAALEAAVRALHSYETPEIIALPVVAASAAYLEWLTANVIPQSKDATQAATASSNGPTQSA